MSNYPAAATARLAWDTDGTRVFRTHQLDGSLTEFPPSARRELNDARSLVIWPLSPSTAPGSQHPTFPNRLAIVFPEPRDIDSIFLCATYEDFAITSYLAMTVGSVTYRADPVGSPPQTHPVRYEYSSDTTNGSDGHWTADTFSGGTPVANLYGNQPARSFGIVGPAPAGALHAYSLPEEYWSANSPSYGYRPTDSYRTCLAPGNIAKTGILGLRIWLEIWNATTGLYMDTVGATSSSSTGVCQTLNLYGTRSAGGSPHVLEFWHPTLNRPLTQADVDQGDVALGSTNTGTAFRLKNVSAETAQGVSVYVNLAMRETTPPIISQYLLSQDGTTWLPGVNLDPIPPGAITPILSIRRQTQASAEMGTCSTSIGYTVDYWT
jgi:hypothetical protein